MGKYSIWTFLPPMYTAFTAVGLWVVYFLSVQDGRVTPLNYMHSLRRNGSKYAPYISLAGNDPPASCVFSQVINLSAFAGFILGVLRYVNLKHRLKRWLNIVSLVALSLACFGMMLLGNFQLFNAMNIHNAGTFMTFGLGTLFCWVQSFITLHVNLRNEGRKAAIPRFLISGAITICIVAYFILMANKQHMHAARTQWALVMFFLGFFSTFAIEFRHFHFEIICTENSQPLTQTAYEIAEYPSATLQE